MKSHIEMWLEKDGIAFLKELGIKAGQTILDFGCGEGHYTIPAAKIVGEKGKVYALDMDIEVLNKLLQIANSKSLQNIVPIHNELNNLKINIESESIDAILLYDVLHYLDLKGRKKIYKTAYRILKHGGLLSVYPKHNKMDEPLWNLANMNLEDIIKEIEAEKFHFVGKSFKKLFHDQSYNMGYILNFRKK